VFVSVVKNAGVEKPLRNCPNYIFGQLKNVYVGVGNFLLINIDNRKESINIILKWGVFVNVQAFRII